MEKSIGEVMHSQLHAHEPDRWFIDGPERQDDYEKAATYVYKLGYSEGHQRGIDEGMAARDSAQFCGNVQGAEVCDRIMGHPGDCSWHSDIIIVNIQRQVAELHKIVTGILVNPMVAPFLPPGVA